MLVLTSSSSLLWAVNSDKSRPQRVTISCDKATWEESLALVRQQVGVREATGRNDGPQVEAYLRSVGLGKGNPWCMALHYWAFAQVSSKPPIRRSGLVRAVWNDAVQRSRLEGARVWISSATLDWTRDGDLIVWGFLTSTSGHIERQISRHSAGWVVTVAGNTSSGVAGSQRDGDGVYLRRRNTRHPLGRMVLMGAIGRHDA
jgi:hypothetical protein